MPIRFWATNARSDNGLRLLMLECDDAMAGPRVAADHFSERWPEETAVRVSWESQGKEWVAEYHRDRDNLRGRGRVKEGKR